MRWLVPLACALAFLAPLLSGCTVGGESATIAGQGYKAGTQSKGLGCGSHAILSYGSQGVGQMRVTVTDGAGTRQYDEGDVGATQEGEATTLEGASGTWTLRVSMGLGYTGQYSVTLAC
jgi:hypothetical protein